MPFITDAAQTLHTPEGRYSRQYEPPFEGPLACGHIPPGRNHAWQRVTQLSPETTLPDTICTECLEIYVTNHANERQAGA